MSDNNDNNTHNPKSKKQKHTNHLSYLLTDKVAQLPQMLKEVSLSGYKICHTRPPVKTVHWGRLLKNNDDFLQQVKALQRHQLHVIIHPRYSMDCVQIPTWDHKVSTFLNVHSNIIKRHNFSSGNNWKRQSVGGFGASTLWHVQVNYIWSQMLINVLRA